MTEGAAHLFSPLRLRDVEFRNRLWVSPMCMYSAFAGDGMATPWHLVHLGSRAVGGAGLVLVEATAVEARGRISAHDLGLWNEAQAEALAPIAHFIAEQGAVPGIQLAHAGRKAAVGGAIAPSAEAFSPDHAVPRAMDDADIEAVVAAFRAAAGRAHAAGFAVVEIHAAHGYLLHEFLSPLANRRADAWGGDLAGRSRLLLGVARAVRGAWPDDRPVFVRISASDWAEGGWDIEESVAVARRLRAEGVDLVDVSSGGLTPAQRVEPGPGYQVSFAARIRRDAGIATGAVGLITGARQADDIVREGRADAVLIARESLRDPYFPLRAARELGHAAPVPVQYERGWR